VGPAGVEGVGKDLAVTYVRMGKPHTRMGAESFHGRVREGVGWDQLAIAARQKGVGSEGCSGMLLGRLGCYMVKPHGPLVRVSCTHYWASTSRLSTLWSTTDLEESHGLGRSHLGVGFPLRCFQRLSRPYLATRRCPWQDNRHTSGTSTPVLSY
jgi:hypothetical protein